LACRSINLVEATLSERRNSVTKSNREGNEDSSRASFEDKVTIKTAIAKDILQARSISSKIVGRGTIRVARINTIPTAKTILLYEVRGLLSKFSSALLRRCVSDNLDELFCAETAIKIFYNTNFSKN